MNLLRQQEIETLTRETDSFFAAEVSLRKEAEVHLTQLIEDKSNNMKQLIQKESKIRFTGIEELEETLQNHLPALQNQIKEAQTLRERNNDSINSKINDKTSKIMDDIKQEQL